MNNPPDNNPANLNQFRFDPGNITVFLGDAVTWFNNDQVDLPVVDHTTSGLFPAPTADLWASGDVYPGGHFSAVFCVTGTYNYQCDNHYQHGMVGTVTVVDPSESVGSVKTASGSIAALPQLGHEVFSLVLVFGIVAVRRRHMYRGL